MAFSMQTTLMDFMIAMVALVVASCRAIPTAPGVVARAIVAARCTSTWTAATGATSTATTRAVLCLLGLLISPKFLKWCKIS